MNKSKNLEWICRRCERQHPEVMAEHSTELLRTCSLCGVENWCFAVTSGRPVKGAKSDTNTTDMAPEAESTEENEAIEEAPTEAVEVVEEAAIPEEKQPEETPVEAVTEDTNDVQVEEATSEETEASTEAEGEQPEAPEHDKVADTVRPTRPTEEPLEAEPEPSAESIAETLDILKTIEQGDSYRELMIDPKADVTAEIAELEAKLAKLKPTK